MDLALLAEALANRVFKLFGSDPYAYPVAGTKAFTELGLEQQAQLVEDWFAGYQRPGSNQTATPRDVTSPYYQYIIENVRAKQY
jgi:hypothetical protein